MRRSQLCGLAVAQTELFSSSTWRDAETYGAEIVTTFVVEFLIGMSVVLIIVGRF
jgi:hypothetical protein